MSARGVIVGVVAIAAVAAGGYWHFSGAAGSGGGRTGGRNAPPPGPIAVVAAAAAKDSVPIEVVEMATIEPMATVAIKSRLDGEIAAVNVREGDAVKVGDLLFTLDARALDAQIRQAQAENARNEAQLADARKELARQQELANRGFAPTATLDKAKTTVLDLEAAIEAGKAQIDNLTVQRSYTEIKAPIPGRLGVITLTAGNLVKANDTRPLAVINQVQPVRALVPVAQRHFELVRAAMAGPEAPQAFASVRERPGTRAPGTVSFYDNTIDPATGAFNVRVVFPNPDVALWPGMVVNVTLRLGLDKDVTVVPTVAVQPGQAGPFVYVVKPDSTVEARTVTVVRDTAGRSIVNGVSAGEQVVTEGQLRLTQGSRVTVQAAAAVDTRAAPRR